MHIPPAPPRGRHSATPCRAVIPVCSHFSQSVERDDLISLPRRQISTFTRLRDKIVKSGRRREVSFMNAVDLRVRAAVAGDADAMTELLGEHGPDVERSLSIAREWRSVLEPADVMQVTYLEAFLEVKRYDPDLAPPFRAWLQRIAENNLRDAIRGLQRRKRPQPANRIESPPTVDSTWELYAHLGVTTTTPSRYVTAQERLEHLDAALEALPDDYGQVVRLYDLQGLPIAEVARRMERSVGAVHMLRARAHDRLREMLSAKSGLFGTST
jgi:RNA polymerase sigma-70 factor, ECF subfamily